MIDNAFEKYNNLKSKYPDVILLVEHFDSYQTFDQDAITLSKLFELVIIQNSKFIATGFPVNRLENYLPKLVKSGFRVGLATELTSKNFNK